MGSAKYMSPGCQTLLIICSVLWLLSSQQSHGEVLLLPLTGESTEAKTGKSKVTQLGSGETRTQDTPKPTVFPLFIKVSGAAQRLPGRQRVEGGGVLVLSALQEGNGVGVGGGRLWA